MSNVTVADNFRVFTSKKSRNRQKYQQKSIKNDINIDSNDFDLDETLRSINSHLIDFEGTDHYIDLLKPLEIVINDLKGDLKIELYCLGLGRFASDFIAKLQFIFIVLLAKRFAIDNLYFYDPVFSNCEKELLQKFDYKLFDENNEGKFEISKERLNIVFFPHCPIELTNNFLWKNWNIDNLEKIIYIGNSFESIVTNTLARDLQTIGEYIKRAESFVDEYKFPEANQNSKYCGLFNNTSVHLFNRVKLLEQQENSWKETKEPTYTETSEFIQHGKQRGS